MFDVVQEFVQISQVDLRRAGESCVVRVRRGLLEMVERRRITTAATADTQHGLELLDIRQDVIGQDR